MRSDESRVSTSRASSPDGRGVSLPISEPFLINPQTSASPNAGQPLAMQKHVRQTIITQQHCVQLAFFRNAGLPAELCRLAGRRRARAARNLLTNPARAARSAHGFWFPREGLNEVTEKPLIAFYGDDFTGSTDAMECLAAAGLRTVLFTDVPSPSLLARFEGLQAMGIAGNSRGLTPDEMDGAILDALAALRRSGAAILHYKVCSTFDSSPTIGSFGRVMDLAKRLLYSGTIPIVVGAPKLGRYSMFGTLF